MTLDNFEFDVLATRSWVEKRDADLTSLAIAGSVEASVINVEMPQRPPRIKVKEDDDEITNTDKEEVMSTDDSDDTIERKVLQKRLERRKLEQSRRYPPPPPPPRTACGGQP